MKRMKLLQNLVKVSLIVLVVVISINFTGCKKTQELVSKEPQPKVEQADQFFNELKKLREDSEKSKEYFEIIDKLAVLVKEEVKRNPERMESFLEDMIGIAVKAGPGLALEVENYADTELKQEMEKLEKKNSELLSQISTLQKEMVQTKEALKETKERLINFLEERRKEIIEKIEAIDKKSFPSEDEVMVILINHEKHSLRRFSLINESTGKCWTNVVKPESATGIYVPPGEYKFEDYTYEGKFLGTKSIIARPSEISIVIGSLVVW
ncbi:hypothetical protein KJ841_02920 [Patescibacteria group bacterium]|nr:hypothetical protein [Patescibacteria group bacterium]